MTCFEFFVILISERIGEVFFYGILNGFNKENENNECYIII
jgi:hypothetical protein